MLDTAAAQGICDRTPQVRDEILDKIGIASRRLGADWPRDCADVTADHLALVPELWLAAADITALQEHDFRGLVSLDSIILGSNALTALPEGLFQGLSHLDYLSLARNDLTTLPEEPGTQGARSVVLDLGASSEIKLRRSDGRGPDAPYLGSERIVFRSRAEAVYTVTVSDADPERRDPYCLSLWGGARCWTAGVLPHAVAGPLGGSMARTEVVLTNRDPGAGGCEAALLFGRGTGPAGAVSFDGIFPEGNLLRTTVPRGGAQVLTLEAPEGERARTGAVHLFTRSPCSDSSLKAEGRILMEDPTNGQIEELVSLPSQPPEAWLGDGDCRLLTGVFGSGRDLALSVATAEPNLPARNVPRLADL